MVAIVLAGGFGTRLKSVVKDVPKPMADINSKPFLEYLFDYLLKYKITDVILCVGYKQEIIKKYFHNKYKSINIKYSSEDVPLGTGGAIKQALVLVEKKIKNILVFNGDTFFQANLLALEEKSLSLDADITLSLKEMLDIDRYGAVKVKADRIVKFQEKMYYKKAFINCGVYMIKSDIFQRYSTQKKFSFEEFLQKNLLNIEIYSFVSNNSYFIDIGIPNDYEKAKVDFAKMF